MRSSNRRTSSRRRGRRSPRTHMYSVLTRVATLLHLNDCIRASDGQRGIEARTGDRLAGYEISHDCANREDQVRCLQCFTKSSVEVGFAPARQRLEAPIKHILKKGTSHLVDGMSSTLQHSLLLIQPVSGRNRGRYSRQLFDLV